MEGTNMTSLKWIESRIRDDMHIDTQQLSLDDKIQYVTEKIAGYKRVIPDLNVQAIYDELTLLDSRLLYTLTR